MDQPNGRFRLTLEKEQWTVWYQWHDSKEKKWEKLYSFEVRNHEADEFLPACRKYENDRDPLCHFMSTNPIIMLRVSAKLSIFPNDLPCFFQTNEGKDVHLVVQLGYRFYTDVGSESKRVTKEKRDDLDLKELSR